MTIDHLNQELHRERIRETVVLKKSQSLLLKESALSRLEIACSPTRRRDGGARPSPPPAI